MPDRHEELMARLRAADPVREAPVPPPFSTLRDRILVDDDAGVAVPTRRPRVRARPAFALGAVALLVIAVVVALTTSIGGSRIDPVAGARAALEPDGQVVHLVLDGGMVQPDGTPTVSRIDGADGKPIGVLSRRIEQWATDRPLRFRIDRDVQTADGRPVGTIQSGHDDDGTSWELHTWDGSLQVTQHASPELADAIGGVPADPTATIRRLLDGGQLHQDGTTEIAGREAVRLVADRPPAASLTEGVNAPTRIEYLVDARTFAPLELRESVEMTSTVDGGAGPARYFLTSVFDVERYERLPLDDVTRALFRVPSGR